MAQKITGAMPDGMDLTAGYTIQWAALDPSSGAAVANVVIQGAAMLVDQVSDGVPTDLNNGPFNVPPLFVPLPITDTEGGTQP